MKAYEVDGNSEEPYEVDRSGVEPAIDVLVCSVSITFILAVCRHRPDYTLSKSGDKSINHKRFTRKLFRAILVKNFCSS